MAVAETPSLAARTMSAMSQDPCTHIAAVEEIKQPTRRVCEECVKARSRWVHLRTCQSCGRTLCCDNSPNRHARRHAMETSHVVIASAEPGEQWLYCYQDDKYAQYA